MGLLRPLISKTKLKEAISIQVFKMMYGMYRTLDKIATLEQGHQEC